MSTILTRQAERLPTGTLTIITTRIWAWPSHTLRVAMAIVANAFERNRQRRDLLRLDHRMLQDMGLREDHVHRELRKWFWQP